MRFHLKLWGIKADEVEGANSSKNEPEDYLG